MVYLQADALNFLTDDCHSPSGSWCTTSFVFVFSVYDLFFNCGILFVAEMPVSARGGRGKILLRACYIPKVVLRAEALRRTGGQMAVRNL